MILMYSYRCDNCGAYLDPGGRCTCHNAHEKNLQMVDELLTENQDGQMTLKETLKRHYRNYMEVEHGNIIRDRAGDYGLRKLGDRRDHRY